MASKLGRNAFTVQESFNMNAYSEWYYEELDLNDEATTITDATCDYNNDPTIEHDTNANILKGMAVSGTGIPTGSYVGVKTSNTEFELYKDGAEVDTTLGSKTDQTLTFKGGVDSETSTYITSARPAKKVVLYEVPGGAKPIEDIDSLTVTINGKTDTEKKLIIDIGDLPFTISGTLMTSLSIAIDNANLDNALSVMSFH